MVRRKAAAVAALVNCCCWVIKIGADGATTRLVVARLVTRERFAVLVGVFLVTFFAAVAVLVCFGSLD